MLFVLYAKDMYDWNSTISIYTMDARSTTIDEILPHQLPRSNSATKDAHARGACNSLVKGMAYWVWDDGRTGSRKCPQILQHSWKNILWNPE